MAIVYGFAGLRIKESGISFAPVLPECWEEYCFQINYEDSRIKVEVKKEESIFTLISGSATRLQVYQELYELNDRVSVKIGLNK